MHQAHTIPWNTLASNLVFIKDNPQRTPRMTNIFARNRATQGKELNHFTRVFAKTISTFSHTERAKIPPTSALIQHSPSDKLFSDELMAKFPEYLNPRNQSIQYWIARASQSVLAKYSERDFDLADAVTVMIYTDNLAPLLRLAKHPQIPLGSLLSLPWGHHYGFCRVAESALAAYIYFNTASAMGLLETGEWLQTGSFEFLFRESTWCHNAQCLPHREFYQLLKDGPSLSLPIEIGDYQRLEHFLRVLFRILYQYDALLRECGVDWWWEDEITNSTTLLWRTVKSKRWMSGDEDGRYGQVQFI
ncbi:hypothetical protein HYDPIDRAFT_149566 [Hydnomerulius pinastri MD-312]|nr:hypothetical protein HYDPIDRAFT_149566 [Hydnomerulius pinastri MD-312]